MKIINKIVNRLIISLLVIIPIISLSFDSFDGVSLWLLCYTIFKIKTLWWKQYINKPKPLKTPKRKRRPRLTTKDIRMINQIKKKGLKDKND